MKKSLLAVAVLATFSFGAVAESPSFSFVELGYTQLDIDGSSVEPDGVEFDFNFELSDNYYLSADVSDVEDQGLDLRMTNIGIGFKSDVSNYSTVFAQIDWSDFEFDGNSEDGYKLGLGVRSNLTKDLEVTAAYEYLDLDSDSSDYYLLGAAYKMNDNLSVYADYKMESDFDQVSFGVRMAF